MKKLLLLLLCVPLIGLGQMDPCGGKPSKPFKKVGQSDWNYKTTSLYQEYKNDYNKWEDCFLSIYYTSLVKSSSNDCHNLDFVIILNKSRGFQFVKQRLKRLGEWGYEVKYFWSEIEEKFVVFLGPFETNEEACQYLISSSLINNGEIIKLRRSDSIDINVE